MTDRLHRRGMAGARRTGSTRKTGILIAAAMALVSGSVVTYFVVTSPRRTRGAESTVGEASPKIKTTPGVPGQPGRPVFAVGEGSKGLSFEIASKSDPTRLAGTIKTQTLEPLEANRYAAEKPESFIFLRDGRTIFVRADSARLYIPKSTPNQPESGTLTGNVEISLYERTVGGVDPARHTPMVRATMPQLTFDLTAWEFIAPDDVHVRGPTLSYEGRNLRLLLNQPKERVELLTLGSSKELRLRGARPGAEERRTDPAPPARPDVVASAPAAPGAPGPDGEKARSLVETFYRATLAGGVRVSQEGRTIDSDGLDLWARLVGGQLAPGAIASVSRPTRESGENAAPVKTAPTPVASAPAAAPAPNARDSAVIAPADTDVVVTWTGATEVRPLDDKPGELAADDVLFRFAATEGHETRFSDGAKDGAGVSGVASQIDYGATSRTVALGADRPDGVLVNLARAGRLLCQNLRLELTPGIATVSGAGSVGGVIGPGFTEAPPSSGVEDRLVRWTRGADFRFVTGEGGMGGSLVSAAIFGDVEGIDHGSSLKGSAFAVNFFPGQGRTGPVSRLVVHGEAQAHDGRGGSMTCDRLDVAFQRRAEAPEQSDPIAVTATGAALASRADATLAAGMIEANLERDAQGRTVVADALASDDAVFERTDGVWAQAPEIRASATRQSASVSGEGATVGKDGSSVTGTSIELDGKARALTVFGAGEFKHTGPGEQGKPVEASARWSRSMTFDDRSGVLEARGETHATIHPDAWTVRELDAGAVRIELTPGTADGGPDLAGPADKSAPAPERHVLRAEATGASLDQEGGGPAAVASRVYEAEASVPGGKRLVEELRLEGDHIVADDVAGTMTVPGRGVLRVVDVRSAPSGEHAAAGTPTGVPDLSARGAARFEWAGSMMIDRGAGTATMREGVRMRHLPIERGEMTELEGEEVVAHIADMKTDGAGARGRLVRASAIGGVWARLGRKELTADRLEYMTAERLIRAASNPANDVTLFDPASPTPLKAKLLEWDLARDRVEVKSPGTIVIPR